MMQSWIRKSGFPLVMVENQGRKLVLHQRRFLLGEQRKVKESPTEIWPIPIIAQINGETKSLLGTQRSDKYEPN
jgi:aminopeptidase N